MPKKIETPKTPLRSLYQCSHAKVKTDAIRCEKGHRIGSSKNGTIELARLKRGVPLELRICQLCADYDEMGPPVPEKERGWAKLVKVSHVH